MNSTIDTGSNFPQRTNRAGKKFCSLFRVPRYFLSGKVGEETIRAQGILERLFGQRGPMIGPWVSMRCFAAHSAVDTSSLTTRMSCSASVQIGWSMRNIVFSGQWSVIKRRSDGGNVARASPADSLITMPSFSLLPFVVASTLASSLTLSVRRLVASPSLFGRLQSLRRFPSIINVHQCNCRVNSNMLPLALSSVPL